MRPISINMASRPFYNTKLYLVTYSVSVGFLILTMGLNLYMFVSDQFAMVDVDNAREQLQRETAGLEREQAEVERDLRRINLKRVGTQSGFAGEVILQRVLSWTLLFNRLEEVMPADVKLRSVRPEVQKDRIVIRVMGLAKTAAAITDFEEELISSPLFADVYPNSETASPGLRGITFDLAFTYLPAAESVVGNEEMGARDGGSGPEVAATDPPDGSGSSAGGRR